MPKYKCKDCRAVWYGWGIRKDLPKMWSKLKLVLINITIKSFVATVSEFCERHE